MFFRGKYLLNPTFPKKISFKGGKLFFPFKKSEKSFDCHSIIFINTFKFQSDRQKIQDEAEIEAFQKKIDKYNPFFSTSSLLLINKFKMLAIFILMIGGWLFLQVIRMIEVIEDSSSDKNERKIRFIKFKNGNRKSI